MLSLRFGQVSLEGCNHFVTISQTWLPRHLKMFQVGARLRIGGCSNMRCSVRPSLSHSHFISA